MFSRKDKSEQPTVVPSPYFNSMFPNWLLKLPSEVATGLGIVLAFPIAFIGSTTGWKQIALIAIAVVICIFIFALMGTHAHYKRWRRKIDAVKREASSDQLGYFLKELAVPLMQEFAAVSMSSGQDRKIGLVSLRRGIVEAVGGAVAPDVAVGTHAHVYEFRHEDGELVLQSTRAAAGPKNNSIRKFTHEDLTFTVTLQGEKRFVPDTSKIKHPNGRPFQYGTFMTYPIEGKANEFYGALTVDCPKAGDLSVAQDEPTMQFLAAMLSATYTAENRGTVTGTREPTSPNQPTMGVE